MPKTPPPLLGFNNNVRHRGRVFHIQREDSGIKIPRIVTHLFDSVYGVRDTRVETRWPVDARGRERVETEVNV